MCERKIRSLKIIKHQNKLWGGILNVKEFTKKYARRRHALQVATINNCHVCYEISEENRCEEFKRNDFESFDVDDFYNLYHSELILKDRKEKLRS